MYSYILDILFFIVLSFYFWRAVFIWEFSFPLLLSFTNCTFIYIHVYLFLLCALVKSIIKPLDLKPEPLSPSSKKQGVPGSFV